jgi:predicted Zn-dependent protease
MRFRISRRTKRRLANRLPNHLLLRLLIFKFWFRLAFFGFVLLVVFLGLFLPPIWTVSPPGFLPIVKVSGLDLVESWSLKRTARREMSVRHYDEANYAWTAAIASNPSDPRALRGLLTCTLVSGTTEPGSVRGAIGQSLGLLRLTHTNSADLELVTDLLQKYECNEITVALLSPIRRRLTEREKACLLKALFSLSRMTEFSELWRGLGGEHIPDPELPLYSAAHSVGWGGPEEVGSARLKLNQALSISQQRLLANRLLLFVSARTQDLAAYQECLQRLEAWHQDSLADHARYWRLLARGGRVEEAKALALKTTANLRSANDLIALTDAYIATGLCEQALRYFKTHASQFADSQEVWVGYAAALVEAKDWEGLRSLGVQIRAEERVRSLLVGYSHFLEGWAALQMNRRSVAEAAFDRMAEVWTGNPKLALVAASTLIGLNRANSACDLLSKFEGELNTDPNYWRLVFNAADQLKNADLLLKAAQHEFELNPEDVYVANHYAAALLTSHQRSEEAIRLTLRIGTAYPNSTVARINHSLALVRNGRTKEAQDLLETIRPDSLAAEEATSFYLALFEVQYAIKDYRSARKQIDRINTNRLFPPDVAWLEKCRRALAGKGLPNGR